MIENRNNKTEVSHSVRRKKVVGKFNRKGKIYHTIYATAITAGQKQTYAEWTS